MDGTSAGHGGSSGQTGRAFWRGPQAPSARHVPWAARAFSSTERRSFAAAIDGQRCDPDNFAAHPSWSSVVDAPWIRRGRPVVRRGPRACPIDVGVDRRRGRSFLNTPLPAGDHVRRGSVCAPSAAGESLLSPAAPGRAGRVSTNCDLLTGGRSLAHVAVAFQSARARDLAGPRLLGRAPRCSGGSQSQVGSTGVVVARRTGSCLSWLRVSGCVAAVGLAGGRHLTQGSGFASRGCLCGSD